MSDAVRYPKPDLPGLAGGRRHAVIEASAGTGKTYVIEHLIIELLLEHGAKIDQILVVTFTERATADLVRRVRAKIAQLADLREERPEDAERLRTGDCWTLDDRARDLLRAALFDFDAAPISTIHAFCQRVLTENAFPSGRLFAEEAVDEAEAFGAAFRDVLRTTLATGADTRPWLEAWLLAKGEQAPSKLEALLRDAWRAVTGASPAARRALEAGDGAGLDRVLRPAFDEAAMRDAIAAFAAALPSEAELDAWIQDGVPGSPKRKVRRLLPPVATAARAATGGHPRLFTAALHQMDDDTLSYLAAPNRFANLPPSNAAFHRFEEALAALAAAAPSIEAAVAHLFLPAVARRLAERKREAGLHDFQDLLAHVADVLAGPRGAALGAVLRERHPYALIDEFQDTDETQWDIFRRIYVDGRPGTRHGTDTGDGPRGGAGRDHGALVVVGDPKQAIYAFRGADVHTYLAARDTLLAGGTHQVLGHNHRSTAPLIRAYNEILAQGAVDPFFRADGDIRYDAPVACGKPHLRLIDHAEQPVAPVKLLRVAPPGDGEKPSTVRARLAARAAIVDELRRILPGADGAPRLIVRDRDQAGRDTGEPVLAKDVFILTRSIKEGYEVGKALRAARIPYAYFKQDGLFETTEAQDVHDLLAALENPDDRSARSRAWLTPFFAVEVAELPRCEGLDPTHGLWRPLLRWRALADAGRWDALFPAIVRESGIVARELLLARGERSLTNVQHVFELLLQEAMRARPTLRELRQTLSGWIHGTRSPAGEDGGVQRLETDEAAVQIMTMHKAKGLEAKVVFLYGGMWASDRDDVRVVHAAGDGGTLRRLVHVGPVSDTVKTAAGKEADDEARRLLYVALTRAQGRLYLPWYPGLGKALRGPYRHVNARLDRLDPGAASAGAATGALFEVLDVPLVAPRAKAPPAAASVLAAFALPADIGAPATADAPPVALDERRRGFVLTSYTALHRGRAPATGGAAPTLTDADDHAAEPAPSQSDVLAAALPEAELPRGRLSGIFLHAALEELPLDTLTATPDFPDWAARHDVRELFARLARRHDRDPRHVPHAQRLVWRALGQPLRLGPHTLALGAAARHVREMEFLYPIPEHADAARVGAGTATAGAAGTATAGATTRAAATTAGAAAARDAARSASADVASAAAVAGDGDGGRPWSVERGFVRGFADLVFEHEGRAFFLDWKSDWLPSFDATALRRRCADDYALQARLYTLALVRLLGIDSAAAFAARFGGVAYVFLRGLRDGDAAAGVHFDQPRWDDVVAFEAELREPMRSWRGA